MQINLKIMITKAANLKNVLKSIFFLFICINVICVSKHFVSVF